MLNYLQRWYVTRKMYTLQTRRDNHRWVEEHDLIFWVAGIDIKNHGTEDSFWEEEWHQVVYFFFRVDDSDQFFIKIRNIIDDCEQPDVFWIERHMDKNTISGYLNLTHRGREVFAVSHLLGILFGNYYVKWITTSLIIYALLNWFHISLQSR